MASKLPFRAVGRNLRYHGYQGSVVLGTCVFSGWRLCFMLGLVEDDGSWIMVIGNHRLVDLKAYSVCKSDKFKVSPGGGWPRGEIYVDRMQWRRQPNQPLNPVRAVSLSVRLAGEVALTDGVNRRRSTE